MPLGNLADEPAVTGFYDGLNSLWASIHIAGGFAFAPIAQSDKSLLSAQLESNLISAYLCSRAAVRAFRRGPGPGRIVNVTARQALEPRLGASLTAYTVSKAGLAALTVALAEEVAQEGILVNAVAPSIMDTPANRNSMPKADFDAWPARGSGGNDLFFWLTTECRLRVVRWCRRTARYSSSLTSRRSPDGANLHRLVS